MSKQILFSFTMIIALMAVMSCKSQKADQSLGTLTGILGLLEGNCMPGPGQKPCKPNPIAGTFYISQPSKEFQKDLLVDSVMTAEDGKYSQSLQPGKYSLFVKDGDETSCTLTNCPDECYCLLIHIEAGVVTEQDITINHATW